MGSIENNNIRQGKVYKIKKSKNPIIENYKSFYNENIKRKHYKILFIMLVLFSLFLFFVMGTYKENYESINSKNVYENLSGLKLSWQIIQTKVITAFLLGIAGISPYFYIPVIGVLVVPLNLAVDFSRIYMGDISSFHMISFATGSIIEMFAMSLAVATGIYFCNISTKKFKYSQGGNFGFTDLKMQYFQIKKDEKNIKKLNEEIMKKQETREKLNVKIPYLNLFISIVISAIIIVVASLISVI